MNRRIFPAALLAGGLCLACDLAAAAPPRPPETVPFASLKVTYAPGRALRRLTLRSLRGLPSDGQRLEVNCLLRWRQTKPFCWAPGKSYVAVCFAGSPAGNCGLVADPIKDPVVKAAVDLADNYEIDRASLPQDGERPRLTVVPIKIDPADLVAPTPPPGAAVLPMENVKFLARPIVYPVEERSRGVQGHASLTCQIQADGRFLCGDVISTPKPGHFLWLPVDIERYWRAAPNLVDGTPSAGRWVEIGIAFKLSSRWTER